MKLYHSLIAFILFSISVNAQYQVGVPVLDSIYSGEYHRIENCSPNEDVNIELDGEVLNYVTGVELFLVIQEINIPQGTLSTSFGELSVNDSLILNNENPYYPFYFSDGGSFKFLIIAKGIPEVEEEEYPCQLTEFISLVICESGYVIVPDSFFEYCSVEERPTTSTSMESVTNRVDVFPNPSNHSILINNDHSIPMKSINIFNSIGQQVLSQEKENMPNNMLFDVSNLEFGLYLIEVDFGGYIVTKKLIVN